MGKFWNWLNGKKTTIAAVYNTAVPVLIPIWFEDGVPNSVIKIHLTIGVLFTTLGVGHKVVKKHVASKNDVESEEK